MMPDRPINGVEPKRSEDDIQREEFGPRGVPGQESPAKMTPQREKKTPKDVDPGHPAPSQLADGNKRTRRLGRSGENLAPAFSCLWEGPDIGHDV
ncbi:hypothetical protein IVB56_35475 [Bradyrhizobium sp. CW7]|uniref:hypothetical protein n=1 Tax=Bradyrhizobium sp. CW7 TaxID=2782688 RepID=UPI001FF761DD|nr:hypothetical protein [Bradyrhizobium sp. CW7]MCK1356229.1 hypothetical protein [Bradyrhizobium sp. CW7]